MDQPHLLPLFDQWVSDPRNWSALQTTAEIAYRAFQAGYALAQQPSTQPSPPAEGAKP